MRAARSWRPRRGDHAAQILLGSCVGGAGAGEGQARVNRFVVIALCAAPPPASAAGCGASRKPPRICCRGQSGTSLGSVLLAKVVFCFLWAFLFFWGHMAHDGGCTQLLLYWGWGWADCSGFTKTAALALLKRRYYCEVPSGAWARGTHKKNDGPRRIFD
jgi:hypothetical protein